MALTKEAIQKYLYNEGMYCPYCDSGNIDSDSTKGDPQMARVVCLDCGKKWHDYYELSGVTED